MFLRLLSQVGLWNILPNSPSPSFYNFWAGHLVHPRAFRRRFQQDLQHLLALVAQGAITPPIAARFPLAEAGAALQLAESHTVRGKVVLVP